MRRRLRAYADEIFALANDAVEFVTMLLLNKHYVQHSHVPTLHGQRKELMHLVNHFYPEDDAVRVMAKAHKKTFLIHKNFLGREHSLFRGGVVTKAAGVCVDGCQYQKVREPRVKKCRHTLSAQADVQAEAVSGVLLSPVVAVAGGRSAATPSVSPALSNHRLLSDLSSASGLSPSLLCDDAVGWFASPPSLSSPLSRFAPPP